MSSRMLSSSGGGSQRPRMPSTATAAPAAVPAAAAAAVRPLPALRLRNQCTTQNQNLRSSINAARGLAQPAQLRPAAVGGKPDLAPPPHLSTPAKSACKRGLSPASQPSASRLRAGTSRSAADLPQRQEFLFIANFFLGVRSRTVTNTVSLGKRTKAWRTWGRRDRILGRGEIAQQV